MGGPPWLRERRRQPVPGSFLPCPSLARANSTALVAAAASGGRHHENMLLESKKPHLDKDKYPPLACGQGSCTQPGGKPPLAAGGRPRTTLVE